MPEKRPTLRVLVHEDYILRNTVPPSAPARPRGPPAARYTLHTFGQGGKDKKN